MIKLNLLVPIVCVMYICLISSEAKKFKARIPSDFPTCYRNDPEINKCLLEATKQVRPYLVTGVPELKMPSFEPLNVPEIKLEQGTQALNFKAVLKNVNIHGMTNYKFSRFDFDIPALKFFADATVDGILLDGDYTISGKVLVAPIEGEGRFTAKIEGANVHVYQKYKEEVSKSDGKVYIVPTVTNSSISVVKPEVHLDGLFGGNQELGEVTNKAINENIDDLFEDFKPVVEHTLSRIIEDVLIKSIIGNVPYDELYPVNPKFN